MNIDKVRNISIVAGPLASVLVAVWMVAAGWSVQAAGAASVTVLCAIWWITEAIPIPATSLIPLAVFPLLGVLTPDQVANSYGNALILLLLGGLLLSTAMAKNGAHRRVALGLVQLFGGENNRHIVWGFMAASAVLSMWISNTATTLMLLPVALAVLESARDKQLTIPLLLGICYAASVGGIGTPIGTPPNLVFMEVYRQSTGTELTFLQWMTWGLPVVICFLPIVAWWLTRSLGGRQEIRIPAMGKWQPAETRVLAVFALTALAWITRKEPFGGWSDWFNAPLANDASVALLAVVILFLIPDGKGSKLLDWKTANKIPWGVLLLFGGGLAIATAFKNTGLGEAIAQQLTGLSSLPIIFLLLTICLVVTFMTEMTSNTATTALLMPILAAAGIAAAVDPALFMVPAAMSASCAFMLPVATAPNAVIFGSGEVPIREMASRGLVLNLLGALVISGICYLTFG